ncbi:MAG: YbdK family carboxylate-amine ligase [Rickettsiales bacterium]|nr:YbdK family carboxylate-amine ligase [Rickettsiales bacterium]
MKEKLLSSLSFLQNLTNRKETNFCSNGILTLGVEVELQLINLDTLNLSPRAEELLKKAAPLTKKIKQEFYLSTVEINTDKCNNVQDVEKDLSESFEQISQIANSMDIGLATTGCHPSSRYSDCVITPSKRYNELIDRNQWLTRRMTVYGMHVHLGMKSGDDAIRFNNFFLNFIPHLLALSASSPFWQGDDTGLASCRPTTYESLPTAGHPYQVKNWSEFEKLCETLKKCKSINSLKDLWWDIRPSPSFGTLEIRVCDGLATLDEVLGVVAFIHLLANWFNDNGAWLERVPTSPIWFARENKWRAIRRGLDAELVINLDGETRPISSDILEWLEKLAPYEEKLGYQNYTKTLRKIIEKGNSSSRQREVYAKTNSLEEVVKLNMQEFSERKPS